MSLGGGVVGVPVVGVGARRGGVVLGGLLHACRVPAGARRLGAERLAPAGVLPLLVVLLKGRGGRGQWDPRGLMGLIINHCIQTHITM